MINTASCADVAGEQVEPVLKRAVTGIGAACERRSRQAVSLLRSARILGYSSQLSPSHASARGGLYNRLSNWGCWLFRYPTTSLIANLPFQTTFHTMASTSKFLKDPKIAAVSVPIVDHILVLKLYPKIVGCPFRCVIFTSLTDLASHRDA